MNGELIRFWNLDIEELDADQVKAEIKVQKALRSTIKTELTVVQRIDRERTQRARPDRIDKIEFFETYVHELDGLIALLEERKKYAINTEDTNRLRKRRDHTFSSLMEEYGTGLSWSKEKFMLVARDRGYLSEQSIVTAIAKELNLYIERARALLNNGKFTWGQVMCLGALLKMNPKEFCDIFMSGYFVEYYGEYIASYKNLDKSIMLKKAIT